MSKLKLFPIVLLLLLSACDKEEVVDFSAYDLDVFPMSLDDSNWEINAIVMVSGFQTVEKDGKYECKLTYSFNLKKPSGKVVSNAGSGTYAESTTEKLKTVQLELQYETTEAETGDFIVEFIVKDEISGKTAKLEKPFQIK